MISNLNILITGIRERGIGYGMEQILSFLFRPVAAMIFRSRFLIEFRYGILPKTRNFLLFYFPKSNRVNFKKSELVENAREFWYSNKAGDFDLDGEKISRNDIFIYGGPNPKFTCFICQKSEWLSRVRQKDLFISHGCAQAKECKILSSRQGNELWTHYHQNFDFSIGCNPDLPAPKGLVMKIGKGRQELFLNPGVAVAELVNRRRFAFAAQIEVINKPVKVDWSKYDFLFITIPSYFCVEKFSRPNLSIIMSGNDWWPLENKHFQWILNWMKPDIFFSSNPTQWKKRCAFSPYTKLVLQPFFDSVFFARPNLEQKKLDLLVIGATTSPLIYKGRIDLDKEISRLAPHYKIEFSHSAGARNVTRKSSVLKADAKSELPMRSLNKWSEYLGSAKYVIFGKMKFPVLTMKHYEVLGSGAIPIFPEVPDLKYLGVRSFEHYIPLSEVEGNNKKLAYYLDNYARFRYIAKNALKWYKNNSDKMIFNDFEDMIREITGYKYPKRIV